jgi:hypothetical protein
MPIATTQRGPREKKTRSGRNGKPPEISRGAALRSLEDTVASAICEEQIMLAATRCAPAEVEKKKTNEALAGRWGFDDVIGVRCGGEGGVNHTLAFSGLLKCRQHQKRQRH